MYKKRASARQLKQWIVTYIVSTDSKFSRKKGKQSRALKVLHHISGPGGDGTIIKHCTDGEVFIKTHFTAEAMRSFFADLEDADSQLDWGNALLILQDYNIHLHGKEYVLQVDNFRLWDLQEGFRRKNTLIHCMQEHRVHQKMLEEQEFQRKEQEQVAKADNSLEESLRLTQLLDEIGQASQESPISVGPSGESMPRASGLPQDKEQNTTDAVPMLPSGETTDITEAMRALKQLLVSPFDVQGFLISAEESEQLKNIKEWRDDYRPTPSLCEAVNSENHQIAVSMETMAEEERKRKEHDSSQKVIRERETICNGSPVLVTPQKMMSDGHSIISPSKTTGLMVISPKLKSCKKIPTSSNRTAQKTTVEVENTERQKFDASLTSSRQKMKTGIYIESEPREHAQSKSLETSTWQNELESVRLSFSESFLDSQDHQISSHGPHLNTPSIHLDSQLGSPSAHSTQRETLGCKDNFNGNSFQEKQLSPVPLGQIQRDASSSSLTGNIAKITSMTGNSYLDEFQSFLTNEYGEKPRSKVGRCCSQKLNMTLRRSSRLRKEGASETHPLADKMSLDKKVVQHKTHSNKPDYSNSSVLSDREQRISIQETEDEYFSSGVDFETQTVESRKLGTRTTLTAEQDLLNTLGDSIAATLPFQPNIYPESQPFNPSLSPEVDISKDKLEEVRLSSLASPDLHCSNEHTYVKDHHGSCVSFGTVAHRETRSSFVTKNNCTTPLSKPMSSIQQDTNGNGSVNRIRKAHERGSYSQENDIHVNNDDRHENERLISLAKLDLDGGKKFADVTDNLPTFNSSKIETSNKLDSDLALGGKRLKAEEKVDVTTRECDIVKGNLSASVKNNVLKLKGRVSDGICVHQKAEIHSSHTRSRAVKRKLILNIQEEKESIHATKYVKTVGQNTAKTGIMKDIFRKGDNLAPSNSFLISESIVKGGNSVVLEKTSQTDARSTDQGSVWDTRETRSFTFRKSKKNKETDDVSVEHLENSLTSGRSKRPTRCEENVVLGTAENVNEIKHDSNLQRETRQNARDTMLTKASCINSSDDRTYKKELVRHWVAGTVRFVWESRKSHDKVFDGDLPREGRKNQGNSVDNDKDLDKIESRLVQYGKNKSENLCSKVNSDSTHILKQGLEAAVKPIYSVAVKPKSSVTGDGKDMLKEDQPKNSVDDFMEVLSSNLLPPTQKDRQNCQIKSQERTSNNCHQKEFYNMDEILQELEHTEVSDIGKQLLHLHFPDLIRTAAVQYILEET